MISLWKQVFVREATFWSKKADLLPLLQNLHKRAVTSLVSYQSKWDKTLAFKKNSLKPQDLNLRVTNTCPFMHVLSSNFSISPNPEQYWQYFLKVAEQNLPLKYPFTTTYSINEFNFFSQLWLSILGDNTRKMFVVMLRGKKKRQVFPQLAVLGIPPRNEKAFLYSLKNILPGDSQTMFSSVCRDERKFK